MDNDGSKEKKVTAIVAKGLDFAGKEVDANKDTKAHVQEDLAQPATYTSSNQQVALISNTGEITPLSVGKTTITVKVGDKSLALDLEVKASPKEAAIKETSITKAAVANNGTIDLTVLDQYGEVLRKNSGNLTIATESGKTNVISGLMDSKQSVKDKLTLNNLTLAKGTETLIIKSGDTIIAKVKVDVIDTANGTVDGYKIVPETDKDLELDVFGVADNTVSINFQEYVGAAQKGANLTVPAAGFTVKSTNTDVATVTVEKNKTTVKALKEGTTKIQYLQGSIVVAEATVTVKNSTPKITSITLKEGKTAIEVSGGVSTNATVIKDIFDELDVKFSDGKATMGLDSSNLTLVEIASIVESNDNINAFAELGNSTAATATTKAVVGDQKGSLAIKVADNYGGGTYVFDVVVKDKTAPTLENSTVKLPVASTPITSVPGTAPKLVFSEELSAESKAEVKKAVEGIFQVKGTAKVSVAWNAAGTELTVTISGVDDTGNNQVTVTAISSLTVKDLAGNSSLEIVAANLQNS